MQKKQILIDGKIISYYQSPHLTSPSQGEEKNAASSLLEKERIERGSTLVFLHGWMQDGKSFEKIFEILEENNIPYISLDLPGFGRSALKHDNMTIEEYGDGVIRFMEKLQLDKPTLVGHSFGGRISIYLGSFYTNLSQIVLIGSAGVTTPMNPLRLAIVKTGKALLSLPWLGKLKDRAKSSISSTDYKSAGKMEKIFRNAISNDLRKYMKDISYPTLMIWWDRDDQTPVSEGEIIHKHIQNSEFHILKWSHFVHQEKAKEITPMILKFI